MHVIRPRVITNDTELAHLTEEVNRLVTKGIKESHLSPEEEKLLVLLTRLIEDYEQKNDPMGQVKPE